MKYKLCQPLLCHIQLRHLDEVIVDDPHGVALNTIYFDFKLKQLCIGNHGITISSLSLFNTQWGGAHFRLFPTLNLESIWPVTGVAEIGSLSARAKMAIKISAKRVLLFCDKCVVFAINCKFVNLKNNRERYSQRNGRLSKGVFQ